MEPFVQERVQLLDDSVCRRFVDEYPWYRGKPVTEWGVDGLLKLMQRTWGPLFRQLNFPKSCIVRLLYYRNKWAHQDPLTDDDTSAALDLIARLLTVVSPTGVGAAEIERIRSTLQQRKRVGGPKHPAEGRHRSMYGPFWESRIEELLSALERAVHGQDVDLDVTAITRLSGKKSWNGSVRVRDCEVLAGKGDMAAHAKALGRVLAESGALSEWPNRVFRLSVNGTGERLSVRLDTSRRAGSDPVT